VRRLASAVLRQAGHACPVTVKCRIGADERDKYEHLCEFIDEVRSAGVRKFIGESANQ
jgi:tRNA-dihydrouridine synthase